MESNSPVPDISSQYNSVQSRINELPERWRRHLPHKCPPSLDFDRLSKQQHDSIPAYTAVRTLYRSLKKIDDYSEPEARTNPIILVFCQPGEELGKPFPYVPVSYCSWLESSGARCIPVAYNLNQGTMEYLVQHANGLVVPGGNSNLYRNYQQRQGQGDVTVGFKKLWRLVIKQWAKGIYFPVWGTCLGLELVLLMISDDMKVLSTLNSRNHCTEIYADYDNSRIFQHMPSQLRVALESQKLINFFHKHGISLNRFLYSQKYRGNLLKDLRLIAGSKDKDGQWFCSFLEGRKNPIFLSQFHPEKQSYEWNPTAVINHSILAAEMSQFFANRFVEQCRKCPYIFPSRQEEAYYMFYQYIPQFENERHFQLYFIDPKFRKNKDVKNPRTNKPLSNSNNNVKQAADRKGQLGGTKTELPSVLPPSRKKIESTGAL